jgi:CheY-like chemotaxis protein
LASSREKTPRRCPDQARSCSPGRGKKTGTRSGQIGEKRCSLNVLIVDDEALQRELLVKVVEAAGHNVTEAADASEALERMQLRQFDLYLLDVFLPDMTALELIPVIKARHPDARIVTLTGQSSRELERRLRELGISYYMAKPFQRAELQSLLAHMEAHTPRESFAGANPSPACRTEPISHQRSTSWETKSPLSATPPRGPRGGTAST